MTELNIPLVQRRFIVTLTLLASFLSVLMQFLLITAFPKVMHEFAINSTEVQWLTTSFMLTTAIFIPITAYFIDTFSTRTLMIGAMLLFSIGTLIALVAPTFFVLLVGRVIQGIGSGILIPLMQTILFIMYPREKRGYAMGLAGMVINVAPAIGPPISGILMNYFDWRVLFSFTLPISVSLLILIIIYMKNVTEQRETKTDPLSIILSTIGFGGVLYGFTKIYEVGFWHVTTSVSIIVGIVSLILFIIRQLRLEKPTLQLRVFAVPLFTLVAFIMIISFSLLIAIETILPLYVQNAQQLSAFYSGLVVMPGAFTLAIMSFLAGRLFDRYGGKYISITGFFTVLISAVCFYFVLTVHTPFWIPTILFMISMGGLALINMPLMAAGINELPQSLISHGTSVLNTTRQFGGSLGLTFIISFITKAESGSVSIQPLDYLSGVKTAFFVVCIFSIIGLGCSFFLRKNDVTLK